MQKQLAKLDKKNNPLPLFITLTYPDQFPEDPKKWNAHLANWRRRYERKWGRTGIVFRKELQTRKSGQNAGRVAPHFHMLVFLRGTDLHAFRAWLSLTWYEIVGSGDERHLRSGASCERARSWKQTGAYLSKYVAKLDVDSPSAEIGRHYGTWWGSELRHKEKIVLLESSDGYNVLRWYRRLSAVRPRAGQSLEIFVESTTVERMLYWLGYYAKGPPGPAPRDARSAGPVPVVPSRTSEGG